MSRLTSIVGNLSGRQDPDDLMIDIMEALNDTVTPIPDVGQFYVFVYNPKTPEIKYDQNPFVAVTNIYSWGFRGTNFHHGEARSYSFANVTGSTYRVYPEEITDLQALPFGKMRLNS